MDYVIVLTGIAGGAKERLLAAAPLLLLLQIVLLPLLLFAGSGAVSLIKVGPFVEAFLFLIVIPLIATGLIQWLARNHRAAVVVEEVRQALMVPLMMVTLAVVIGLQISAVGSRIGQLLLVVPLYVAFLIVMPLVGWAAGGSRSSMSPPSRL